MSKKKVLFFFLKKVMLFLPAFRAPASALLIIIKNLAAYSHYSPLIQVPTVITQLYFWRKVHFQAQKIDFFEC